MIAYTLQIYFDFSGYSDMAIGLGAMFGFTIPENFNFPYIAISIRDFWRRWHISLSTWFRDYLYIPLGGSQVSRVRVYLNLYIVFFLTGLWHGASWTFIFWGLLHGTFMVLERLGLERMMARWWFPLRHIYALLIVVCAWVFFRAPTLERALHYLGTMFSWQPRPVTLVLDTIIMPEGWLALLAGLLFSMPVARVVNLRWPTLRSHTAINAGRLLLLAAIFLLVMMNLASGAYNPFIYFRF